MQNSESFRPHYPIYLAPQKGATAAGLSCTAYVGDPARSVYRSE